MEGQVQVAVFIDFENIALSAENAYGQCELTPVFSTAEEWGRCVIRRAYGDWTRFSRYKQELIELSVELIQLFSYGIQQRKNAADIQMVVDALETAFTHPDIGVFVLVTGDSDYSAVARKLRSYGKTVVGVGQRQATSEVLVKACDRFILYDALVEPETRTVTYSLKRARELLLDAMRALTQAPEQTTVLATALKQAMLRQDPTFNELRLGYAQFRDFLQSQDDLVELDWTGPQRTELVVALKPAAEEVSDLEETAAYRSALAAAGLRLLEPRTRAEVLHDLFGLLSQAAGKLRLEDAILQLKAQYDTTGILRSREEVQGVASLLKYADVLDPSPQSWELDALTIKPELDAQQFVDQCESVYIGALLQKNLPIEPDVLALLLFGTSDQRARVEQLARVARDRLPQRVATKAETGKGELPDRLRTMPALQVALDDLDECAFEGEASPQRATELATQGMSIRTVDFEQARGRFLEAACTMYDLLRTDAPGASLADLEWYLASYCGASAGACFFRHNYTLARKYYLAFFALARETESVWEKVRKAVPPMLSFYFTTAANEHGEILDYSPGQTHPARMAAALCAHPNPSVRDSWTALVEDLAAVNSTLLRTIIQRLETVETLRETPGAGEARDIMAGLLQPS